MTPKKLDKETLNKINKKAEYMSKTPYIYVDSINDSTITLTSKTPLTFIYGLDIHYRTHKYIDGWECVSNGI